MAIMAIDYNYVADGNATVFQIRQYEVRLSCSVNT